jgi:hypothetical protein
MRRSVLAAGVVTLCIVIITPLLQHTLAWAHSWYPKECCRDTDCAPVNHVAWTVPRDGGVPQMIVTSSVGTVTIPINFPRRESPDGRMHVCIQFRDVFIHAASL